MYKAFDEYVICKRVEVEKKTDSGIILDQTDKTFSFEVVNTNIPRLECAIIVLANESQAIALGDGKYYSVHTKNIIAVYEKQK